MYQEVFIYSPTCSQLRFIYSWPGYSSSGKWNQYSSYIKYWLISTHVCFHKYVFKNIRLFYKSSSHLIKREIRPENLVSTSKSFLGFHSSQSQFCSYILRVYGGAKLARLMTTMDEVGFITKSYFCFNKSQHDSSHFFFLLRCFNGIETWCIINILVLPQVSSVWKLNHGIRYILLLVMATIQLAGVLLNSLLWSSSQYQFQVAMDVKAYTNGDWSTNTVTINAWLKLGIDCSN